MQVHAGRSGLFGRALSGGALTAGSYVIGQGLRLASNLVLTRLLFPEAFGVMALVTMVLIGLSMFSDTGVGPAISRSVRGDERRFLDTAWTINVIRGALLWLASCALAWPMSRLYGVPDLALLLPAAGLTLLIGGFNPTRIDTANRHLLLARVTALDLISQVVGILVTVGLAWITGSIWSLIGGALLASLTKLCLTWAFLPGEANRFHWEPEAKRELLGFGKWIFLSTACGFLLAQGDKAILGAYLTLAELGIYNIGYFLASFPMLLAIAVVARIMIPIYRDHPQAESAANAARIRRLRFGLSAVTLCLLAVMALAGEPLVQLLYDDRYLAAGAIICAVALVQMPAVIGMTYDQSALAAGDGQGYFLLIAAKAGVQTLAFLLGAEWAGLGGALLAQGLALALVHPLIALLARKHRSWDALHDAAMIVLALVLAGIVLAIKGEALLTLAR